MNEIHLHGALGEEFGPLHLLAVDSPREAIKALSVLKGDPFTERLRNGSWRLIRKKIAHTPDRAYEIDETLLAVGMQQSEFHIFPAVAGSNQGKSGTEKIIMGTILVGAAILSGGATAGFSGGLAAGMQGTVGAGAFSFISAANVAMFGTAIALGGIAQTMAPSPGASDPNDAEDDAASFLFNGAVNVSEQGHPVPLVYGQYRVGSVVAASGITVEGINVYTGETYETDEYGDGGFWDPADYTFTFNWGY